MNNKELYRETFSQVHGSRDIRWEDYENMKTKGRSASRMAVTLAAAVCALAALSATALAMNFLGLRDLLLPGLRSERESGTLSLSGYMDAPESRALAEWMAFLEEYDADHAILDQVGNYLDPAFDKYICYLVYTQDMADKLEEIAARYSLRLHTDSVDLCAHPEALGELAEFSKQENTTYWSYMYEDGSCHFDGYAFVEDWGLVDVQFQRSVKGSFNDVTLDVGDISQFQQWTYETASGVEATLALSGGRSIIFADRPDCFVFFNVFIGTDGGMTRERLEAVCDCYDFSKVSPVVTPELPAEAGPSAPAVLSGETRERAYANALWALWGSGVLPDGSAAEPALHDDSGDQFAIFDVDGDGNEELVVLYQSTFMAGMRAYVMDYDGPYAPLRTQLCGFPMLTFYENGGVTEGASHNQGLAGDALWPYTLWSYLTQEDAYVPAAYVDAWEKESRPTDFEGNPFPDELDKSGTGVLYYVSPVEESGPLQELDRAEYESWRSGYLGQARPLDVPYQALTRENIAAVDQTLPQPVQTVPPEGMPKG